MDPAWIAALAALSVAVAGFVAWMARHTWRVLRRIVHFLDDYAGQEARDGMPARPGFMARLSSVEAVAAGIAAELRPNGGQSLRDVVHRTAADVTQIKADQTNLRSEVEAMRQQGGGQ